MCVTVIAQSQVGQKTHYSFRNVTYSNLRRPTYCFVLQTAFIVARSPNVDTALDNIADIRNQPAEFCISNKTFGQFPKHKKLDEQGS